MSVIAAGLYFLLSFGAGILVLGLVDVLTVAEAVAGGVAAGTVMSAAITLLLSFVFGLHPATVFAGPLLLGFLAYAAGQLCKMDVFVHLRRLLNAARRRRVFSRWVILTVVTTIIFSVIFSHAIVDSNGALNAGYTTVWADWETHLSAQSSFVLGHNLPPHNSLYAATPLLYPFLGDFHAAELNVLGLGPGASLAVASVELIVCLTVLLVCLALRLRSRFLVGVLAAAIIFVGGGWGFSSALSDACASRVLPANSSAMLTNAYDASLGCSPRDLVTNPGALSTMLRGLPGLIANQPRAYDDLPGSQPFCAGCAPGTLDAFSNTQWYTPLLAWWLPQRPMAYGTATVLLVLVVALAIAASDRRLWMSAAVAGVLVGLLPLIHVHALLALLMAGPLLVVWKRRKEWLVVAAVGALVALPRMLMLLGGPHGADTTGLPANNFPTILVGWLSDTSASTQSATLGNVFHTAARFLNLPFNGTWWLFWLVNLGVAVPVVMAATLALLTATSLFGQRVHRAGLAVLQLMGHDVAVFAAIMSTVFVAANLIVFQSWPWDNTKLFAYWYIGPALLISSLTVRLWSNWWRNTLAIALYTSVVLTGTLVVARLLPWTPATHSITNLNHVATPAERVMVDTIVRKTAPDAIFVTTRNADDPVVTLAGRTTLMGFWAWMWSYGVDFGIPPNDRLHQVATILRGCATVAPPDCKVWSLLRQYQVSYVEIDSSSSDPTDDYGNSADPVWWSGQNLPIVASAGTRVVYDVRRHG